MNTLLGHALKPTPYANGGKVSPAMAALRRLKSRREAANYAQQQLDAANKKAGKSTFLGSLGGLAGGLGIPALAGALGFTPVGLPLAILAGLGTAGGAYLGKKKGYGKDVDIDEDMRYGGSEFLGEGGLDRQVVAQDAFTDAFGRDSVISGVKAGLTAGLDKTGGIYGSAGKFGQKLTGAGLGSSTGAALIPSYAQSFGGEITTASDAVNPDVGTSILDMSEYGDLSSSITQPKSGFDPSTTFGNLTGRDAPLATEFSYSPGSVEEALQAPLFQGLRDEAVSVDAYSSGLEPGFTKASFDADILPDADVSDFNFEDEFSEAILNQQRLYYDSPEGRKELGLPQKGYFQDVLKQSRNRAKERLFPQDSFNINNLLAMLGNN